MEESPHLALVLAMLAISWYRTALGGWEYRPRGL